MSQLLYIVDYILKTEKKVLGYFKAYVNFVGVHIGFSAYE